MVTASRRAREQPPARTDHRDGGGAGPLGGPAPLFAWAWCVTLPPARRAAAPLFAGGVVLRSPARAPGCYQCSPGGVALHSFARAPGPPHSSPGAWYFALPRAALVPLRARGRGASLVRPRAGPPTCGTLVSAAGLAQLVEQLSCKQQVIGSSPIAGSMESLTAASQPQPTSPVRVRCPGLVNEKCPATSPRPSRPAPPVADSRAKMASTQKSRDTRTTATGARTQ